MRRNTGFTLIELLTVVTIIAVLIVVAFANMRNGRKTANEANTIAYFKLAVISNEQYRIRYGRFPPTFDSLVQSEFFTDGQNPAGYSLIFFPAFETWAFQGDPQEVGETGDRYFYVDQTGVIRFALDDSVNSTSTPVD